MHLRFSSITNFDPDFGDGEISSCRYSLFSYDGPLSNEHNLIVQIDVFHPTNHQRSFFEFSDAKEIGKTSNEISLLSYFETVDGHRIGLIPVVGAKLVLAESASNYSVENNGIDIDSKRSYLAPHGLSLIHI